MSINFLFTEVLILGSALMEPNLSQIYPSKQQIQKRCIVTKYQEERLEREV
jgi:hypothetical protein